MSSALTEAIARIDAHIHRFTHEGYAWVGRTPHDHQEACVVYYDHNGTLYDMAWGDKPLGGHDTAEDWTNRALRVASSLRNAQTAITWNDQECYDATQAVGFLLDARAWLVAQRG